MHDVAQYTEWHCAQKMNNLTTSSAAAKQMKFNLRAFQNGNAILSGHNLGLTRGQELIKKLSVPQIGDPKSSKPPLAWLILVGNSGKGSPEGQNSSRFDILR